MAARRLGAPESKAVLWTGRVISALPALMLAGSAVYKLAKPGDVKPQMAKLGFPEHLCIPLGILELTCVIVYAIPQTAVLGAILITGYMGGAIATHVRLEQNFFFQVGIGVLAWLGLLLRDRRLAPLLPFRT
jgi:hypothetical protein